MAFRFKRIPFYVGLATLVVSIVVTLSGPFLWISHRESKAAAVQMADRLFSEINTKTLQRYENILESVAMLAGTAIHMPGMARAPTPDGLSYPGLPVMIEALMNYDFIFSTYTGYDDGSFIQVVALRDNTRLRRFFSAPAGSAFVLRIIAVAPTGELGQRWRFLDPQRRVIGERNDLDPNYDPRQRPWYIRARREDTAFFTEPYLFSSTKIPGTTCARKLVRGDGVFGVDITLDRFSVSLERQKVSDNGMLFLFDRKGRIIAHPTLSAISAGAGEELGFLIGSSSDNPLVRTVVTEYQDDPNGVLNRTREIRIDGSDYLMRLTAIKATLKFDQILAAIAPVNDFTGHIRRMQERIFIFSGLVLMVMLPLVLLMSRKISSSLTRLEKESIKIRRFDFSDSEPFDSNIREIHSHIQAFVLMKTTIQDRTDALIATQKKLETLVQSGIALTAEKDMDHLLHNIFDHARALSRADGGTLFLRDDSDHLRFEIMQDVNGEIIKTDDESGAFAPIPILAPKTGGSDFERVESRVARSGRTVVINHMDDTSAFDFSHACRLDEAAGVACSNFLTVPLRTREGHTIGVLQVFNARDEKTGEIIAFDSENVGFVEALAAQATVALHNKRLIEEQRVLFDALIQLIAGAIDAKSHYTGGHCARVPELATMLARAAHDTKNGAFADFRMETEDQWREFNVAAWLHDCGKVTTPEYVVDKATKLETIYNRIHEIRMRFEVLLRDAQIDYYLKRLAADADEGALKERLEQTRERIEADFAFIAECNVGGEYMADEKIERLRRIASRTWVRHLDDRIGISREEAVQKNLEPAPALPVVESVLADKLEHVIPRTNPDPFDGNPFNFKMSVPRALYNHGELYNLSIRKGTLSPEDRFKINEHIIQTINMLKKLPFPEYLKNVAEFAGSHHETMIGTGYPRRLKKEQMPIPARILAIADIFEALTAADRPYKTPKKLSEAIQLMSRMRDDQHIDAELFDLFLERGVFRIYAEQFLQPAQCDDVEVRRYLSQGRKQG